MMNSCVKYLCLSIFFKNNNHFLSSRPLSLWVIIGDIEMRCSKMFKNVVLRSSLLIYNFCYNFSSLASSAVIINKSVNNQIIFH